MTGRLTGKRCIVTGGGSGIGRAICHQFIAEGATVDILGRARARLEETRAGAADPRRVRIHAVDLADRGQLQAFVDGPAAAGDPVRVLVNNAGIFRGGSVTGMPLDEYDLNMKINLDAVYLLTRGVIPRMAAAGGGSIVNIASSLGYMPQPDCSAYSAAKAGVLMLTRCVALEYAGAGIRCNAISPGVVRTPIFDTVMEPDQVREYLDRMTPAHPLGRLGEVADIARAAVFLASDEAAWVTGVNLPVDGGISLT
jgi:NAD(P)-dependent dehydrogenase (short-subunit alcohol dehydrogenase family)